MKILITGGCGFIASNFINYFFYRYPESTIINIDAMYYCSNEKNVLPEIRESKRYKLFKGNLCSFDLVNFIINDYEIEYVIHFAAQSHVQNSFTESLQYNKDNILATHTLLEVCRNYGQIKKFIHVSTDEVYGETLSEDPMTESSVLCPTNPYAATKAGAELIAQSYYKSFNMPIIITRGNNVYGPNQYPEKVIPLFIKQLKENKKVTIQGNGSHLRSFLHVLDVCEAFELILMNGTIGEIYNIGNDKEYTVMEVAKMLIESIQGTTDYDQWITYIADRPFNDKRYYISSDKVKNLGWEIKVDFEEGLAKLVNDY